MNFTDVETLGLQPIARLQAIGIPLESFMSWRLGALYEPEMTLVLMRAEPVGEQCCIPLAIEWCRIPETGSAKVKYDASKGTDA